MVKNDDDQKRQAVVEEGRPMGRDPDELPDLMSSGKENQKTGGRKEKPDGKRSREQSMRRRGGDGVAGENWLVKKMSFQWPWQVSWRGGGGK